MGVASICLADLAVQLVSSGGKYPNIVLNLTAPPYLFIFATYFKPVKSPATLLFNYSGAFPVFAHPLQKLKVRLRDRAGRDAQLQESLLQAAASARSAQR
jgi:hypothetical protein